MRRSELYSRSDMTNLNGNNPGMKRTGKGPLWCTVFAFIAVFIVIGLVMELPFILNSPTRAEWQIMKEVERLGGHATFPNIAPACSCVDLRHSKVTDRDLALLDLGRSRNYWALFLSDTRIGDPGMKYVAQIGSLRYLDLANTRVTDTSISQLASLPHLEWLDLSNTQVTDAAVPDIARIQSLVTLVVENTAITDSGIEKLTAALPNLFVSRCRSPAPIYNH